MGQGGRPSHASALGATPSIVLFSLTALTSAFLVFWVEPLVARLVLPLLGGSPAVWNTCLVFFQAALLGGYLYAHLTSRYLGVRRQALLHLALLGLTLGTLPVAIHADWAPPASDQPIAWLLGALTAAVGAPFFMLSATAPLLQRWLAGMDHPRATDPYPLYAASNAGSLLGLMAFPAVLEPTLRLGRQASLWSAGYVVVLGLASFCALLVWRSPARSTSADPPSAAGPAAAPAPGDRARWMALAFVPSSLLLGVTSYLTTDVASVPLLWVVPLAIYLLSFVVVFARPGRTASRIPVGIHVLVVMVFVVLNFWNTGLDHRWAYPLHLGVFALTALVLHDELATVRPAPLHLTEYYLWLAIGGALGGAFNALLAPVLFDTVAEYVPMVVLACFLRTAPQRRGGGVAARLGGAAVAVLPAAALAVVIAFRAGHLRVTGIAAALVGSAVIATIPRLRTEALVFGACLVAVGLAGAAAFRSPATLLRADRSFFGAYRVVQSGQTRLLYHGTTVHGVQLTGARDPTRPAAYYHPAGPPGQVFEALESRLEGKQVAVVGLGVGSLLCYARPGQSWTFYEIDPLVERLARDPAYFTFLRDCPVQATVVLGDARLTLGREPPGRFALLVLDAFISDAIPVHLLTREALAIYRRVLAPGGALLFHISNTHLELEPVVAALAADAGMLGLSTRYLSDPWRDPEGMGASSQWVLLATERESAGRLTADPRWSPLDAAPRRRPWTDDHSNVFGAMRW